MPERNIKYEIISSASVFLFTGASVLEALLAHLMPVYASVTTYFRYTFVLLLFYIHSRENRPSIINKSFGVFFIIYSLYILWYMSLGREIPLSDMFAVPDSVSDYIIHWAYLSLLILCSDTIIKYLNIRYVLILWLIFILGLSLYYISLVGFETMQVVSRENYEAQFIGPLTFSYNSSLVLVFVIFFNKYLSPWKKLNFILCVFVVVAVGYIWLAATKRGPILWSFVAIIIVYFFKNRNVFNYLVRVGIIVIILWELVPILLEMLKDFAPYSVERINAALYEGDTSYRLTEGEEENVWVLAYEQWTKSISSFLLGTNCRITQMGSMFYGVYPHNIFLEFVITMGVLGLLYFVYHVSRIYMSINNTFKDDSNEKILFFFCLFNCSFTTLMTTSTLVLNYSFWVSFGICASIPMFIEKKYE